MLIHVFGAKCIGIDAVRVTVEVDIDRGIGIHLCGLADVAVKESLLRTITALTSLDYRIPGKKIVINLAPGDLRKSGSGYDLPIAVGIVAASGQRELPRLGRYLMMGELGLDASLRDIPGALPIAELAVQEGFDGCILPRRSALEAVELEGTEVYGVERFEDVIRILEGEEDCTDLLVRNSDIPVRPAAEAAPVDFADIIGQDSAKRGVEIAAAGGHNVAMIWPPGSGKSSLAKAMAGILPPMTQGEALQTSKIYSIAGKGDLRYGLVRSRPFRSPHYSASMPAVIGGGTDQILPGEISLAHNGILFLDELGQMPKALIEALRGPMEDREVVISRLKNKVRYPASFMLVAASNPCPCGYYGEGDRCTCTVGQRTRYLSRLSGPVMDRIDIQLWVRPVQSAQLGMIGRVEPSAAVAERVRRARTLQQERFASEAIRCNAEMDNRLVERFCPLDGPCREVLGKMMDRQGLSMRAYYRIIKVARTIADLAGAGNIQSEHLLEAASFRFLDRRETWE